jgi:hypothetical protein
MTLSELMCGLSVTTPVLFSLWAGWKGDGVIGGLIGLMIGLGLGLGSFCGMRFFFRWAVRHPLKTGNPESFRNGLARSVCGVAMAVWIYAFSFLAMWLTELALHGRVG